MTLFQSFALVGAVLLSGPTLAQSASEGEGRPALAQAAATVAPEPAGDPAAAGDAVTAPADAQSLGDEAAAPEASGVGPHAAADISFEAQRYHTRPLVVFADSPENPQFLQQINLLNRALPDLAERRVVVVIDTDPAAQSEWRRALRPRGFSLVLLDSDLKPVWRKPAPWDVREISRSIDRLPSRREDLRQQFPGR